MRQTSGPPSRPRSRRPPTRARSSKRGRTFPEHSRASSSISRDVRRGFPPCRHFSCPFRHTAIVTFADMYLERYAVCRGAAVGTMRSPAMGSAAGNVLLLGRRLLPRGQWPLLAHRVIGERTLFAPWALLRHKRPDWVWLKFVTKYSRKKA